MKKRLSINRLNDLDGKAWLKFQKSWFLHNPPPRRKAVLKHPAKFPETLAQEFIEFFTHQDEVVLDPMAGTGSTLVAALRLSRRSYGIELNPAYHAMACQVLQEERASLGPDSARLPATAILGNAAEIAGLVEQYHIPPIDYVLTSPPYWDMLHANGAQTQKARRLSGEMDVYYSDDPEDLGNIHDYAAFLDRLTAIYRSLKPFLKPKAYLTIVVKNVKKGGQMFPLAWDLGRRLGEVYTLKDEKIWVQDNQRLAPYGFGSAWVSNTFHHYCLQFRNES